MSPYPYIHMYLHTHSYTLVYVIMNTHVCCVSAGLFAVEMSCSKNQSCNGSYNMTFTDTTFLLLSVDSGEEKWRWSYTEIQEFTLDVDDGHTVLSLTINR